MSEFRDPFPSLPQVVDVGGDRYFMGSQKPIELGFKDRADYIKSFGDDSKTEYLIRKYLDISLIDKKRLTFDDPKEKADLIAVLKKRASKIQDSNEFTSSALKNTVLQRSYINIQRLIQQLEGPDYKGFELSLPDISLPCTKAKKYIREIPEDRLFQLMLEISWYLLHPDDVPEKVKCDWAKIIKQLDTLRIGDIMAKIKVEQDKASGAVGKSPFNYFKRLSTKKAGNSLDEAKEMAMEVDGDNATKEMRERLKTLIDMLEIKKYLSGDLPVDKDRLKIIDVPAAEKISKSLISNPMRGGMKGGATNVSVVKALDKPLGIAMKPLFNYFKVVFDPIYSLLESGINTYSGKANTEKVMIPQLTTLLHICNNINPSETTTSGANTYGVYRITNVDETLLKFINSMIGVTATHVSSYTDDVKKNAFNTQLFQLPKVRLSSLLNKFVDADLYKDPESIPYIQIFTVGGNMTLLSQDKFMNVSKPEMTEAAFKAVDEFFKPGDLYILCTKSDNAKENIPMNLYQVDYDKVDVGETGIVIDNMPNNYFNKNKKVEFYLENLVKIEPYVVFNDAELALSIFILFKELMPK